jgi:cysteine desulfurase
MRKPIYLDHGATTPADPEVVAAMLPYWTETYGNPSSVHQFGRAASRGLEEARQMIAGLLNSQPAEIIFTSCGSESDNLALRGVMLAARASGRGNHLITSAIEHKAVLDTAVQLRDHYGFDLTILPVDEYGQIDLAELEAAVQPDTVLISIMAANNEIGSLQPILSAGQIAHAHGVLFHSDAIQAAATTHWNMATMPIDLLSLAPHKFYGPKGVGILYLRRGTPFITALTGGSQEEGRRAGTVNVPLAVGAATAFQLAQKRRERDLAHYEQLRDRLISGILSGVADAVLTGHPRERLAHHASFALRGVNGNDLLMHLDLAGIAASSGSACLTGSPKPAAVLEAIGLDAQWTLGGLRFTVGRHNSLAEIEEVIKLMPDLVARVRQFGLQ